MKHTNTIKKLSTAIAVTAAAFVIASCGKVKEEQFGIGSPTSSTYTDEDLVWVDNFDQKELDANAWSFETHAPGWVNSELQAYVVSDKNVYLKDGKLIIQPLKEGNSYTSGRINTMGKKEFTYGRFEARLKVPRGKGYLPAFWMMPGDEGFYGQWPKCGEIDIMEVLGHEVGKVYGSLHFGEPHTQKQGTAQVPKGNFADDFHIFATEWDPGEIRFYVDDRCYYKTSDWFTKKEGFGEVSYPAPFDQPFYMILNVAVGGVWPGYPDEYTTFDEQAQMVVDYVKVYQKKSYDENVKRPEAAVAKMEIKQGNIASNLGGRWMLHLEPDGKAKADLTDDGLTVVTEQQGAADYSVQLVQSYIQVVKGETYRYTFDAWADEPRTIKTAITLPNNSWKRAFGDVRVALDTKKKTYTYTFEMNETSDENARLEYQLGNTSSTATVHIQNIKLEHVKNAGPVNKHPALPDGNLIYNGQFQEGENRMGNWDVVAMDGAKVYASNENKKIRELKAEVPANCAASSDVKVIQKGIKLTAGSENVIRFEASSTVAGKMTVKCGSFAGEAELGNGTEKYEFRFVAPKDGKEVAFEMDLGIPGAVVTVDNVSLKEAILVQNGSFDKGMKSYEVYAHSDAVEDHEVDEGQPDKFFSITIDKTGREDWMIQLMQRNVELVEGKTYKLTFKAKSDLKRDIMVALQRDGLQDNNWIPYSGQPTYVVSDDWKTFEHEFTMDYLTDSKVILTFSMGAVNQNQINRRHTVCIDSISLIEVK